MPLGAGSFLSSRTIYLCLYSRIVRECAFEYPGSWVAESSCCLAQSNGTANASIGFDPRTQQLTRFKDEGRFMFASMTS